MFLTFISTHQMQTTQTSTIICIHLVVEVNNCYWIFTSIAHMNLIIFKWDSLRIYLAICGKIGKNKIDKL